MIIIILSYLIKSSMREYYHSNTILHLPTSEEICTSHKKEHIFICICICASVCEEDVHEKKKSKKKKKE